MNRRGTLLGGFALLAPVLVWMSACANDASDAAPSPPPDDGSAPVVDGGAPDGPVAERDSSYPVDAPAEAALCNSSGWCWTSVPPGAAYLEGVGGSGPEDVWAVGLSFDNLPIIIHWDGALWKTSWVGTLSNTAIYAVWAPGPGEAWAVGSQGVLHFESGAWTIQRTPDDDTIYDGVWGASRDDFWVVGGSGTVTGSPWGVQHAEREADGGLRWTSHVLEADSYGGQFVMGRSKDDVWVGSYQGLWHYTRQADGGSSWAKATVGGYMGDLWVNGDGGLFTGAEDRVVVEAGVATATTLPHEDAGRFDTHAVWGAAADDLWFVGGSESATINHWDGTLVHYSHSLVNGAPIPGVLTGVWGSSSSDVWVVGAATYLGVGRGVALHRTGP